MSLTDPVPNYEEILIILYPLNIFVALAIGTSYFWRYKQTKASITFLWAFGFMGVGISLLFYYLIEYIFSDFFITILPSNWDYSMLKTVGMLLITFSLGLSTFFIKLFKKRKEIIGRVITSGLAIFALILLIYNSFITIEIFDLGSWITRILAIWVIIFFAYFSISTKNYRIFTITIGLILATMAGIFMTSYHGTQLGLIGNFLQFGFYILIAYGLFFTRQKAERENLEE